MMSTSTTKMIRFPSKCFANVVVVIPIALAPDIPSYKCLLGSYCFLEMPKRHVLLSLRPSLRFGYLLRRSFLNLRSNKNLLPWQKL